nr:hypothetical protein CFP56_10482 [Quercus suber]
MPPPPPGDAYPPGYVIYSIYICNMRSPTWDDNPYHLTVSQPITPSHAGGRAYIFPLRGKGNGQCYARCYSIAMGKVGFCCFLLQCLFPEGLTSSIEEVFVRSTSFGDSDVPRRILSIVTWVCFDDVVVDKQRPPSCSCAHLLRSVGFTDPSGHHAGNLIPFS